MGRSFEMTPGIVVWVAITLMGVLPTAVAIASHPVSVTTSQVYVTRERITARIDVFVEDLFIFHKLKPNDQDFLEPDVIAAGIVKHKQFLLTRFVIRGVDGQRIVGRVVDVKKFENGFRGGAARRADGAPADFSIGIRAGGSSEFLTFSQHFTDGEVAIPAEMSLIVKQENAGEPRRGHAEARTMPSGCVSVGTILLVCRRFSCRTRGMAHQTKRRDAWESPVTVRSIRFSTSKTMKFDMRY